MADFGSLGDAELVAAARAGNMEAFAGLADRHRGMIVALARRLLGTDDLVADVTQEATVATLVSLGRLRSPRQFGAWYAGIALNVARSLLREVPTRPLPEEYPDGEPGPAEQAEAAEVARRVREAVATLAPGQRAAVLAFYWQGLTTAAGSRLTEVRITRLVEDVFYPAPSGHDPARWHRGPASHPSLR